MAAKRKMVTVADHDRLFFTRWVLFLLVANEAAGLPQVSRERLHALLFMSFASCDYYGIQPLRKRARRTPQGPYYRQAHVALGGLVLGGMVSVHDFKAHPAVRDLQFEGSFRPTMKGVEISRVMRQTITGARLYRFLLDMCLGAAAVTGQAEMVDQVHKKLDRILDADLTYRKAVARFGDSLEIQDDADRSTPTVAGLTTIQERLDVQGIYNRKDVLAAYQSLLLRRTTGVA